MPKWWPVPRRRGAMSNPAGRRRQATASLAPEHRRHALDGNPGLDIPARDAGDLEWKPGDLRQVGHEQREVAHRERARSNLAGRKEQDCASGDLHDVDAEPVDQVVEHSVLDRGAPARRVQVTQVGDNVWRRAGDLDRLYAAEQLAEKAGHSPDGFAAR